MGDTTTTNSTSPAGLDEFKTITVSNVKETPVLKCSKRPTTGDFSEVTKKRNKCKAVKTNNLVNPTTKLLRSHSLQSLHSESATSPPGPSRAPPPSFCSQNRFAPLSVPDVDSTPADTQPIAIKPPPIYIKNISNYLNFCRALSSLIGPDSFQCKSKTDNVMLLTKTAEGYRKAVEFLRQNKFEYHTYQLKTEKAFRVVFRHLHSSLPPQEIKSALNDIGFETRSVTNVIHPGTKVPLPLFFVDLEPAENNKEIFKLKSLLDSRIQIEEPYKTIEIIQCKRCQQYGHSRTYCNHAPRCVKCAGTHSTSDCLKPRDVLPTCVLCQGNHPANYRGCITHKELQRLRRKSFRERTGAIPSQLETENSARPSVPASISYSFPPLRQQDTAPDVLLSRSSAGCLQTYAEVTGRAAPQSTPLSSSSTSIDLTSLLTSFISDFKALITPLITLLTTVVTNLIPKLSR